MKNQPKVSTLLGMMSFLVSMIGCYIIAAYFNWQLLVAVLLLLWGSKMDGKAREYKAKERKRQFYQDLYNGRITMDTLDKDQ